MDLVVDQVVQLQHVHIAHGDRLRERFAGAAVEQARLAVLADHLVTVAVRQGGLEQALDNVGAHAVEDGRGDRRVRSALFGALGHVLLPLGLQIGVEADVPAGVRDPAEVQFQHLAEVHSRRHAQRVEHDVDRGAVRQERHVLLGQDARDAALVAVTAGQLVAHGDLAVLRDVHADHLVDAVRQLVAVLLGVLASDLLDRDDGTGLAVGHAQRRVAHLAGLLSEDGAQQALLRGQLGLALRSDLADEDVAGLDLGANADDASLVEVGHRVLADVRQIAGDLLGAQLGLAGIDLVLLDVDGAQGVVLHEALRDDHGVLVVVAVPRHERDEQVLAEGQVALLDGGAVSQHGAGLDALAVLDDRALVVAGGLVGTLELGQLVGAGGAVVVHHADDVGGHVGDHARLVGDDDVTGIVGNAPFGAGAHQRALGLDQRHGLTLHVGTHQRSVALVVLQERNQGGADRDHLTRRHVHQVDFADRDIDRLFLVLTGKGLAADEPTVLVDLLVHLGDDVADFLISGHVHHFIGDLAVDDLAVRRFDETERVHAAERRQRADQTDVRAFRGLDRAHTTEVGGVHVSHFHRCAVARQAAGAQGGQTALVGHAGQRVVLVHELGQLGGSEELLDGRVHGADVDQGLRGDGLGVLRGHALAHDALHTAQAGAQLVLDQLADLADTTVSEVIDIVHVHVQVDILAVALAREGLAAVVQGDQVLQGGDDVVAAQGAVVDLVLQAKLAVDLVAADAGQVVALGVEVEGVEQVASGLRGGGVGRADLAVQIGQGLVLRLDGLLLQRVEHERVAFERIADLGLGHADGHQEDDRGLLALAVDTHAEHVALVDLELQPCATARDDLRAEDLLAGGAVPAAVEVDARGAHELGDDHSLGAADDEGAVRGLQREVAHEHGLGLDLAGVAVLEFGVDVQRRRVGVILLLALLHGVAGLLEVRLGERQAHGLREVLDRGDLVEDLVKAGHVGNGVGAVRLVLLDALLPTLVADQPVEAVGLHAQQVGHGDGLADGAEIHTVRRLVQINVMLVGACDDGGGIRRSLSVSQWTFLIAR